MIGQVEFERTVDSVLAQSDENGIWVHCGWSMAIQRAKAVEYVKAYNTDPSVGFFEHAGKVILSHNGGKITFSEQEAAAIVQLIKAAYPEA